MQYPSSVFEQKLRGLIEEELQRLRDILAGGLAIKDFAEYKFYVGEVKSLEQVLEYCEYVNSELEKAI